MDTISTDNAPLAEVIDLSAERRRRQEGLSWPLPDEIALRRYNDLARQICIHEKRHISGYEAHAVVYTPHVLGLGFGPEANCNTNPAERNDHALHGL